MNMHVQLLTWRDTQIKLILNKEGELFQLKDKKLFQYYINYSVCMNFIRVFVRNVAWYEI